jgi:putative phosphoribosyl transferase
MVWFHDREEAGRLLAGRIRETAWDQPRPGDAHPPLVLGLARGGVPVAAAAAEDLGLQLDAVVVRKVGLPSQPELALGALATYAGREAQVRNEELLAEAELRDGPDVFDRAAGPERLELARREEAVHGARQPVPARNRTVLVVDDGLATGATMLAAIEVLRAAGASRVVVAVPVSLGGAGRRLAATADGYVSLGDSPTMRAVGQAYHDFSQVDMDTVVAALR